MDFKRIGRFNVVKKIGAGNQGTVFLCVDPELQRRVAIKMLDQSFLSGKEAEETFYGEARTMSQIQHPNIVSIYEAGKQQNIPYLVFEFVEGQVLGDLIEKGKLTLNQLLEIFQGILQGIERAHRLGIVHRDLKPANVIVNEENIPKVMDFGIARVVQGKPDRDQQLTGSPRYMAPEYIQRGEVSPQVDIFALGLILYEMLTGQRAFQAKSQAELLHKIVNLPVERPSRLQQFVDERLDQIVLKAVEKDPASRYPTAAEFLDVIKGYLAARDTGGSEEEYESGGTIDFLIRRMKRKDDFPAMSQTIRTLNALTMSSDKDVADLSNVIVKDFALTNKILKVVNSAFYGHFAGKISTITRAVVVLGMKPVRSLAASLIFFEHLHNQVQADALRSQVSSALFSAVLASKAPVDVEIGEAEEFFLAAMLHNLGKVLVTYYLTDEGLEIERLISQERVDPMKAERSVLGTSFQEVGRAIAKRWNFPPDLLDTMRNPPETAFEKPKDKLEKRWAVACFANQVTRMVSDGKHADPRQLAALQERYGKAMAVDKESIKGLLKQAKKEFKLMHQDLSSVGADNSFIRKLEAGTKDIGGDTTQSLDAMPDAEGTSVLDLPSAPAVDTESMLSDGLQEVSNMMVNGSSVSEIANDVLELMYRSAGFHRVLLALKDRTGSYFVARMAFGNGADQMKQHFRMPIAYQADVFHAALKSKADVYISDAFQEKIVRDLPEWYRHNVRAGSFVVFPLVVKNRQIGLIYADHPKANGLDLAGKKLTLLKALRNQLVLACQTA